MKRRLHSQYPDGVTFTHRGEAADRIYLQYCMFISYFGGESAALSPLFSKTSLLPIGAARDHNRKTVSAF
jgi:hypothetical protein